MQSQQESNGHVLPTMETNTETTMRPQKIPQQVTINSDWERDNTTIIVRLGTAPRPNVLRTLQCMLRMINAFYVINVPEAELIHDPKRHTRYLVRHDGGETQYFINILQTKNEDECAIQFCYISGSERNFLASFVMFAQHIIKTGVDVRRVDRVLLQYDMLPIVANELVKVPEIGEHAFRLYITNVGNTHQMLFIEDASKELFGTTHYISRNRVQHFRNFNSEYHAISCLPRNRDEVHELFTVYVYSVGTMRIADFQLLKGDPENFKKNYVDRFETHVNKLPHMYKRICKIDPKMRARICNSTTANQQLLPPLFLQRSIILPTTTTTTTTTSTSTTATTPTATATTTTTTTTSTSTTATTTPTATTTMDGLDLIAQVALRMQKRQKI